MLNLEFKNSAINHGKQRKWKMRLWEQAVSVAGATAAPFHHSLSSPQL
jgi:hypothetical protein